jgi:hypothetical protein
VARSRRALAAGTAAAALALAFASPAGSALIPHLDHPRILPNEAIGGVRLDMTRRQVFDRWGPGACGRTPRAAGRAINQSFCRWGPRDFYRGEHILIRFINGEVDGIILYAWLRRSDQGIRRGELARRWRTREGGVHLGSPIDDVKRAYPGARPNRGEAVRGFDLFAGAGRNQRYTRFSAGLGASVRQVATISMQWEVCHHAPDQPCPRPPG